MENGEKRRATIKRQADFIFMIGEISKEIQGLRESRPKKVERLKHVLADPKNELVSFDPVPLPLDPSITVVGCFPGRFLFRSPSSPTALLTYRRGLQRLQIIALSPPHPSQNRHRNPLPHNL